MAMIPTAWGACGIVWKNRENESAEGFTCRPGNALLCRICTPGLTAGDLRAYFCGIYPGCMEVLCNAGGSFHPEIVPGWFAELRTYLQSYYSAALRHWPVPRFLDHWAYWQPRLDWEQLTAFQRRVLQVVANIPSGEKLTYGAVAAKIGKPKSSRAVGAAIGNNPWPVLVPCHRVVGASGKMTGFSAPGGVETKRKMLDMEAV
ncbi:MAG TPA: MGMT family protein [Phycisphaerae bacterium]|jgi:O-6-methylguanine DNA methyltransferase